MSEQTRTDNTIVIERTFDAPVDLIWQLWTDPEHFKNWYGPEGLSIPVHEMDVTVGGKRLICMEMETPKGMMKMWTTGEYTEVNPTSRLVYTDIPCDENGNPVPMPQNNNQPFESIVTVELEDLGGRTRMTMTHAGMPEGSASQGANAGWNQSFDKLAKYAETLGDNE